eukprot:gnl/MRDRNA2_/MRDRNA2_80362_c0_seq1.p1 gnl/MRDRNA2_/MRDRNA2_80362_c0~~gnl/MRDRNA2_/MRDRNA2_80362_c0_seq1.p1  ORF type:complete len:662 (+),score=93.20 gnl/MRDRNA2_/MRDRNA2_80362_c0_seq1:341-2326(+)
MSQKFQLSGPGLLWHDVPHDASPKIPLSAGRLQELKVTDSRKSPGKFSSWPSKQPDQHIGDWKQSKVKGGQKSPYKFASEPPVTTDKPLPPGKFSSAPSGSKSPSPSPQAHPVDGKWPPDGHPASAEILAAGHVSGLRTTKADHSSRSVTNPCQVRGAQDPLMSELVKQLTNDVLRQGSSHSRGPPRFRRRSPTKKDPSRYVSDPGPDWGTVWSDVPLDAQPAKPTSALNCTSASGYAIPDTKSNSKKGHHLRKGVKGNYLDIGGFADGAKAQKSPVHYATDPGPPVLPALARNVMNEAAPDLTNAGVIGEFKMAPDFAASCSTTASCKTELVDTSGTISKDPVERSDNRSGAQHRESTATVSDPEEFCSKEVHHTSDANDVRIAEAKVAPAKPTGQSPYLEVLEDAIVAGTEGTVASPMRYPLWNEVNTCGSDSSCTVRIRGLGVHSHMCTFIRKEQRLHLQLPFCHNDLDKDDQVVYKVFLNGQRLQDLPVLQEVKHGDRLILGFCFCFRCIFPGNEDPDGIFGLNKKTAEDALREVAQQMALNTGVENPGRHINSFLVEYAFLAMDISEANAINCSLSRNDECNLRYNVSVDGLDDMSKQVDGMPKLAVSLLRRKLAQRDPEDEEVSYLEPWEFRAQLIGLRRAYTHWFHNGRLRIDS